MTNINKIIILDDHYMRASGYAALLSLAGLGFAVDGSDVTISDALPLRLDEILSGQDACIYVVGAQQLTGMRARQIIQECLLALHGRPFILLSDNVAEGDIRAAIDAGVSGIVPTNTTPEIAVAAIRFIFSGGHYFPHTIRETDAHGSMKAIPPCMCQTESGAVETTCPLVASDHASGGEVIPVTDLCMLDSADDVVKLTGRQNDVMLALAKGLSNKEIGRDLNLSESTVKVHVRHLMQKFGMNNRTQLALIASSSRSVNPKHKRSHLAHGAMLGNNGHRSNADFQPKGRFG